MGEHLHKDLFDEELVEIVEICEEYDFASFNCGEKDINDYLILEALNDKKEKISRTYITLYDGKVTGYYTLTNDLIRIDEAICQKEGLCQTEWPAIKVARIATDVSSQNKGLGSFMLKYILGQVYEVSNVVGCRFVRLML